MLPAQHVHLANLSPEPQRRWTIAALPADYDVPEIGAVGPFVAVRGPMVGRHSRLVYVLADLQGKQLGAQPLRPINVQLPAYSTHPWVSDDPVGLVPRPVLVTASGTTTAQGWIVELEESGPVRKLWHLRAHVGTGLWYECWLSVWSGQAVVDAWVALTWSDRSTPDLTLRIRELRLESGEQIAFDYRARLGIQERQTAAGWSYSVLRDGVICDGQQILLKGAVLARESLPGRLETVAAEEAALATGVDLLGGNVAAAVGGPITACWNAWGGKWLAFGVLPERPEGFTFAQADDVAARFYDWQQRPGNLWDQRPLANALNTGATGAQPPFGATKDGLAVTAADPRRIWELGYSATDYAMRVAHHRELDGSIMQAADRFPGRQTWGGYPDWRNSTTEGMAGKPRAWQPSGWPENRRGGADDQHRGELYILAYYALTGDPAIRESLRHWVQTDLMMVPNRTGAARAMGRLWISWCNYMLLLPDAERRAIRDHAAGKLALWEQGWAGGSLSGPVRPGMIVGPDARMLKDDDAWVPWQESILLIGAYGMAQAHRRLGEEALADRYEAFARPIARTLVLYGTFHENGRWWPINACKAFPDGAAGDASYYTMNRTGWGFSPPSTGSIDLLVGTQGWWIWTLPGFLVARELLPVSDPARIRAETVIQAVTGGRPPDTWDRSEWRALGSRR